MTTGWVYFFGDGQADGDPRLKDILGGKGASLAAMSRAGLPVPPGFTISTECCRLFLEAGGRWPEGLEMQVREALARLEESTGRRFGDPRTPLLVSVRSGAAVSMPGMMDTILNCGLSPEMAAAQQDPRAFWRVYGQFVVMFGKTVGGISGAEFEAVQRDLTGSAADPDLSGDQLRDLAGRFQKLYADRTGRQFPSDPWGCLIECIEMVFGSWNNPRAVAYRREHGIRGLAGTAVNVQSMFPARVSGVVFTVNPNDRAAEEMIVESSYGLGEAVVSGDVHPDHFVVERRTFTVKSRAVGHKTRVVVALGDAAERDPDSPSLSDQQVGQLARLALNVEQFFGEPMDIEWGLAEGKFALLQSRPIRALDQAEAYQRLLNSTRQRLRDLLGSGRGPWVLHNLSETLPHPMPLTWSVLRPFMSGAGGFGRMYRLAGFEPSAEVCRDGFLELIAGKVYMDVALAAEMFWRGYPFRYDLELLRSDPDAAQSPPTIPSGSLAARVRAARRVTAVNRRLRRMAGDFDRRLNERIIPDFTAWCRQEKQRALSELSAGELAGLWRRRLSRVMDEFAPLSLLPSLIGGMALAELRAFLAENFWSPADADTDPGELASTLSAPVQPDKTMLANARLYEVARGRLGLQDWLAEFGHRAAEEFDLAAPRWREQPEDVLSLAGRLKDGADPSALLDAHVAKVAAELEALSRRLAPRDRAELDRRVGLARRYMIFREDGKHYLMLGYDLLRDVALEAGRRLGLGEDVFLLTQEEMLAHLPTGRVSEELVARRRADYRAEARLAMPHVIDEAALETLGEAPRHRSAGTHAAFALSTGSASGPAWIVRSPKDACPYGRGYVLVCASTDPAWTPLFVNAAGLVLECGGTLSHGAVIAREMGIPAVVLPGATALLTEGRTVTVDGHHGLVTLGSDAQAGESANLPEPAHVPRELAPPPPGRRERSAARLRNFFLLLWGAFLAGVFFLPANWLYAPAMAALDWLLWPIVAHLGKPAAVALVAAALALLTMLGQRWLTDNARLREAKRRANVLTRLAGRQAPSSPRRANLLRLAAPVQARTLSAALAPLSVLLGPMVMSFVWLPARVDPAVANAAPGSAVSVVASVDGTYQGPVRLSVDGPLYLDDSSPAEQTPPPARAKLESWLEELRQAERGGRPSPELAMLLEKGQLSPQQAIDQITRQLDAPVSLKWKLLAPPGTAGRFAVSVAAGDGPGAPGLSARIVLGDLYPPAPTRALADGEGSVRAVKLFYERSPAERKVFWTPLAGLGRPDWDPGWLHWDPGWLLTYLATYLPVMLLLRWLLRLA